MPGSPICGPYAHGVLSKSLAGLETANLRAVVLESGWLARPVPAGTDPARRNRHLWAVE